MNRTVALLELSGESASFEDLNTRDSIRVAQRLQGYTFPIYDTHGDITITLALLDLLYRQGKRIFIGFNRSTMLAAVSQWFINHPDAVGISLISTAPSLRYIKNVYRLSPSGDNTTQAYMRWMSKYDKVYILYEPDEIAITESLNAIGKYATEQIPIASKKDLAMALAHIRDNYNGSPTLIIPYLVSDLEGFINMAYQYISDTPHIDIFEDISAEPPSFSCGICKDIYANRYYYLQMRIVHTPVLDLLKKILGNRLSLNAYDAVLLARSLGKRGTLYGATGPIIFNEYNDRTNIQYDILMFNGDRWIPFT